MRFIFGALYFPVEYWDERTNIAVVEDTVENKAFILPTHEDRMFYEKPPVWYTLTALVVLVFGNDLIFFRIISLLSSFSILASLLYIFKQREYYIKIIFLILFSLTSQFFFANSGGYFSSHTLISADLDSLFIAFLLLSQIFFLKYLNSTDKYNHLLLAFIFVGLAIMTKGPFALVWSIVYVYYLIRNREVKKIFLCLGVLSVVILPWYILVYIQYGYEYFDIFFNYHILQRIIFPIEQHSEAMYFYFGILINPFISIAGIVLGINFVKKLRHENKPQVIDLNVKVFLLSILVLSIMQTKLAWYVLPLWINLLLLL